MISIFLSIIVPTFGIVGMGWLSRKVGIWKKNSVGVLNSYAYYIALPALIFQSIITSNLETSFSWPDAKMLLGVVAAHLLVMVFIFLIFRCGRFSADLRATMPMLVVFGNTAYLGIPYATYAFGKEGTIYASLLSVALVIVILFVSLLLLSRFTKTIPHRNAVVRLLELPFLWAVIAGLLWPIFRLPALPLFLSRFVDILAGSAGPIALLGLGAFLFDLRLSQIPWASAMLASLLKAILPTVAVFFLLRWLGVTGVRMAVGLAMAATPTAVTCFVLSDEYKLGEKLTAGVILLSIFFSLAVLSLITFLWLATPLFQ